MAQYRNFRSCFRFRHGLTRSRGLGIVSRVSLGLSGEGIEGTQNEILPFFNGSTALNWPDAPHDRGFMITLRHKIPSRTPLDE
jgi:hypothetical protein